MNSIFEKELQELINKHSMENGSNTPDFMLARYLAMCLYNYEHLIRDRDRWYRNKFNGPLANSDEPIPSLYKWRCQCSTEFDCRKLKQCPSCGKEAKLQ